MIGRDGRVRDREEREYDNKEGNLFVHISTYNQVYKPDACNVSLGINGNVLSYRDTIKPS